MVRKLFHFGLLLVLAPALCALAYEAGLFLLANGRPILRNWATYGFVAYGLVYLLIPPCLINFLEIFEHELGHAVAGLFLLQRVEKFTVDSPKRSGEVITAPGSLFLISLAPYFLPVFTLPLLVVRPVVFPSMEKIVDLLIGVSLGFHYMGLAREFRIQQMDISRYGLLFSLGVTAAMNLILLVIIFSFCLEQYAQIGAYFRHSLARMPGFYRLAWRLVLQVLGRWL